VVGFLRVHAEEEVKTVWGRVDWSTPTVAAGQCLVTSTVMAVGASLGDVLPGG
jgi:hypothetical protein